MSDAICEITIHFGWSQVTKPDIQEVDEMYAYIYSLGGICSICSVSFKTKSDKHSLKAIGYTTPKTGKQVIASSIF